MVSDVSKYEILKGFSDLMIVDQQYTIVLEYFSERQRNSKISDINQLAVYIRAYSLKHHEHELPLHIIMLALNKMATLGLGRIFKKGTKQKFEWRYWPTPIFDNHRRLTGIKLKELSSNKNNLNEISVTKTQLKYELKELPLENLLREIARRGFTINIEKVEKP